MNIPNRMMTVMSVAIAAGLPAVAAATTVKPDRARELERLVRHDCGSCHGITLKGGLGPDIRAKNLDGRSVDSIAAIILDGVPGTPMPPWRPLINKQDANWIAQYLLTGGAP